MLCIFDLFKTGPGPSSSHTSGPMLAAVRFVHFLEAQVGLAKTTRLEVRLFGSLALTGKGHQTGRAVILGLAGLAPQTLEREAADAIMAGLDKDQRLPLGGTQAIAFEASRHIHFDGHVRLPFHANALRFDAFDETGDLLASRLYYSIGGGFVVDEDEAGRNATDAAQTKAVHPFASAAELLEKAEKAGFSIAELMLENECARQPREKVLFGLDRIWANMQASIEQGLRGSGHLPGGLRVRRRAADLHARLLADGGKAKQSCERADWVTLWAMAVNEQNAAGGRVVTAPTNGAAGVIPAVIQYYLHFVPGADQAGVREFLLTAAAIGALYKRNASISGAEVGCQGEVGVACSMAAGALAAVMGGTSAQIENAAEIGMEHNLGMTCDPVGGLVQIPCIERNAFGAAMAIQAARLALLGDGRHAISLDEVIKTMFETGRDMSSKYKETAQGGLAVNVVEC